MIPGLDFLGLGSQHWKLKQSIEVFPQGWALGCFAQTFGDALPAARKFLASGKVSAFRLQAWWSDSHKIAPMDFLKKELPRWEKLAREFPHVRFYISHSCEYSEADIKQIRKRVILVQALCPSCEVVQCPMHSPVVKGVGLIEQHGTKSEPKPGHIVSTDGQAIFDQNAANWMALHQDALINFLWAPRFNLREAHNTLPPPARKAFPTKRDILSVIRLASSPGIAPSPVFAADVIPFKKPELLKTHAEDQQGNTDARANRPLVILKKKTKFVEVVTFTGQVLGKLTFFGNFGEGLYRYYAGHAGGIRLYGYEIGEKAKQASGSEFVWFKQGNKYYGPVNPAFRVPFYQQ
jgi:hypothetical protein